MARLTLLLLFTLQGLPALAAAPCVWVASPGAVNEVLSTKAGRMVEKTAGEVTTLELFNPLSQAALDAECSTPACVEKILPNLRRPATLVLYLRPRLDDMAFQLDLFVENERIAQQRGTARTAVLLEELSRATAKLFPEEFRRGFGTVRVEGLIVSKARVDGRSTAFRQTSTQAIVPLSVGTHWLEVQGEGATRVDQVTIDEGKTITLAMNSTKAFSKPEATRSHTLRYVSYGIFSVGAASLASSFFVATAAKRTQAGMAACSEVSRNCASLDQAQMKNNEALGLTRAANVLLGVGIAALGVGTGLFVVDAAVHSK